MSDYQKLSVWQKSNALALNVHTSVTLIRGVMYAGLRSQILRAAMSVPANIVEGSGRQSRKEFARFLRIALNSSSELEYHLSLAKAFGVLTPSDFASLSAQATEVRKMLHGVINTVL